MQLCVAAAFFLNVLDKGFSIDLIPSDPVTVTSQEPAKVDVGPVRRVLSDVRVVVGVRRNICVAVVIVPVDIFRSVVLIESRLVHVASLGLSFTSTLS